MSFEGMSDREIVDLVMDNEAYEIHLAETYPDAYVAGIEAAVFDLETAENPTYSDEADYRTWSDKQDSLAFMSRFPLESFEDEAIDEYLFNNHTFLLGGNRLWAAVKANRRAVL